MRFYVAVSCIVGLLSLSALANATPSATHTATASRSDFCGVVKSVNRDARTFRLRTAGHGVLKFKVTAATRYIDLSGFGSVKVGRRFEVYSRRSGSTRLATSIEPYSHCGSN